MLHHLRPPLSHLEDGLHIFSKLKVADSRSPGSAAKPGTSGSGQRCEALRGCRVLQLLSHCSRKHRHGGKGDNMCWLERRAHACQVSARPQHRLFLHALPSLTLMQLLCKLDACGCRGAATAACRLGRACMAGKQLQHQGLQLANREPVQICVLPQTGVQSATNKQEHWGILTPAQGGVKHTSCKCTPLCSQHLQSQTHGL